MGLRDQAAADAKAILENTDEFGWPITVTDPDGFEADLVGFSTDVHLLIDPETGQAVSGRSVSVTLPIASIIAAGLAIPRAVAERTSKPWVVEFENLRGDPLVFKVSETNPDETLGIVTCMLEVHKPAEPAADS